MILGPLGDGECDIFDFLHIEHINDRTTPRSHWCDPLNETKLTERLTKRDEFDAAPAFQ